MRTINKVSNAVLMGESNPNPDLIREIKETLGVTKRSNVLVSAAAQKDLADHERQLK